MSCLNFLFRYIFDLLIYLGKWIEQPRNPLVNAKVSTKFPPLTPPSASRKSSIATSSSSTPMCTWTRKTCSPLSRKPTNSPKKSSLPSTLPKTPPPSKWSHPKNLWNKTSTSPSSEHKKTPLCPPPSWWRNKKENSLETRITLSTRSAPEDSAASGKSRTNSRSKSTQWNKYPKPSKKFVILE